MLVVIPATGVETGAVVVATGWAAGIGVTTAAGVAGAAVAAGVTGCDGADEAQPAKKADRNRSPQTIPMMIVCLEVTNCFMVNRSIA